LKYLNASNPDKKRVKSKKMVLRKKDGTEEVKPDPAVVE